MISFLCPSRGRPEFVTDVWRAMYETTTCEWELLVCLDRGDPMLQYYQCHEHMKLFTLPERQTPIEKWNYLAEQAQGDCMAGICDGIRIRTKEWDKIMFGTVPPEPYWLAYFTDGYTDKCTAHVIDRAMYEFLGYVYCPDFHVNYMDWWNGDVAKRAGRCWQIPEIYWEHLTPDNGKCESDEGHKWVHREQNYYVRQDMQRYNATEGQRQQLADKLTGLIAKAA